MNLFDEEDESEDDEEAEIDGDEQQWMVDRKFSHVNTRLYEYGLKITPDHYKTNKLVDGEEGEEEGEEEEEEEEEDEQEDLKITPAFYEKNKLV